MKHIAAISESNFTSFIENKHLKFDRYQLTNCTYKWVQIKDTLKVKEITQKLKECEPINKLATNPLLLSLLFLVFAETSEFPSTRSQLYQEGLEILLKRWDARRNQEDQAYKKLSVKSRQDLFSQIALKTFERGDYLFQQQELEQYIADYIYHLPYYQNNLETLHLESQAVLKSIQAQHELLVELKPGIYSFSDLTFHEYFTAREIINSPDPQALDNALQNLARHVSELRWREVFLQSTSMLRNANYLLSLIKQQANNFIASNQELQFFLNEVNKKSHSFQTLHKPVAFRAFYIEFVLDLDFNFARTLDNNFAYDFSFNLARIHTHADQLQSFQLGKQQKQILKQYYNANKLLMDCLNNAHYVTRNLREEIEETLLVPQP